MTVLRPATPDDLEPLRHGSRGPHATAAEPDAARRRARARARRPACCGWLLLVALVATAGCDAGIGGAGPPSRCRESGVQCQLPEGPLGVCERLPCPPGQTAPCFACTPQH